MDKNEHANGMMLLVLHFNLFTLDYRKQFLVLYPGWVGASQNKCGMGCNFSSAISQNVSVRVA
ncbi:hypothetical protein E2C01_017500 [Portunus trituberculatus]|uniref:Uncharacterized protein n=1 Tax=Portunus trituberculatus TaxID=210409 RepID=A0A5B7DTM1_PORTR|nr:hypothetical protein [Portunus trituberculatus]